MVARETRRLAAKTVLDTKQNGRVPCGVLTAVAAVAEDGRRTLDRKPVTHHDNSSATIGRTRGSAGAYKVMMRRNQPPRSPPLQPGEGGTGPRSRLRAPFVVGGGGGGVGIARGGRPTGGDDVNERVGTADESARVRSWNAVFSTCLVA